MRKRSCVLPTLLLLLPACIGSKAARHSTRLYDLERRNSLLIRKEAAATTSLAYEKIYVTKAGSANEEGLHNADLAVGEVYLRKSQDSLYYTCYDVMAHDPRRFSRAYEQLVYVESDPIGMSRTIQMNSFWTVHLTLVSRVANECAFSLRYPRFPSHTTQLRGVKVADTGTILEVEYLNYVTNKVATFTLPNDRR